MRKSKGNPPEHEAALRQLERWRGVLYALGENAKTPQGKKLIRYRANLLAKLQSHYAILRDYGFSSVKDMAEEITRLRKATQ